MSYLIIGGDSKIGKALYDRLSFNNEEVYSTSRKKQADKIYFNLEVINDISRFPKMDTAFICAGVTKFKECQEYYHNSYNVNVLFVEDLCKQLIKNNTEIIYLSTNAVFDGTSPNKKINDTKNPKSYLGHIANYAENRLLKLGEKIKIVRMTKVITKDFEVFSEWYFNLERGSPVAGYVDVSFAPVHIDHVIDSLLGITESKTGNIFHISSAEDITYYEAMYYFVRRFGRSEGLIVPMFAKHLGMPEAFKPRYTSLGETFLPAPWTFECIDKWLEEADNGNF